MFVKFCRNRVTSFDMVETQTYLHLPHLPTIFGDYKGILHVSQLCVFL